MHQHARSPLRFASILMSATLAVALWGWIGQASAQTNTTNTVTNTVTNRAENANRAINNTNDVLPPSGIIDPTPDQPAAPGVSDDDTTTTTTTNTTTADWWPWLIVLGILLLVVIVALATRSNEVGPTNTRTERYERHVDHTV